MIIVRERERGRGEERGREGVGESCVLMKHGIWL